MKQEVNLYHLIFLTSLILSFVDISTAQETNQDPTTEIIADVNACELNSAHFDMIANLTRENKERIIVIARAGKGETDLTNAKRLNYVKWYLQNGKGWKNLNVIYARGERINDAGRLEFYVTGKLWLVTIAPKNETPCMDCCESDTYRPQNLLQRKIKDKSKRKGKS